MDFVEKIANAVSKSWNTAGSVSCKIAQSNDRCEILFFPTIREICGGNKDGAMFFPGFNFNIGKFIRIFDKEPAPKVTFDCLRKNLIDHLLFRGFVDGNLVKIAILAAPPGNQEATERVYAFGPKKGTVEEIKK